jgi:hypothetical protein
MNPTIAPVIVVDVAGKVLHPGVYKLPQDLEPLTRLQLLVMH